MLLQPVRNIAHSKIRHAVHAMGEMNLCFEVVNRLKAIGITCLAATTRRLILFENKGLKSNKFEFVQFRKY